MMKLPVICAFGIILAEYLFTTNIPIVTFEKKIIDCFKELEELQLIGKLQL